VAGVLKLQAGTDDVAGEGGTGKVGQAAAGHNPVRGRHDDVAAAGVPRDEDGVGPTAAGEDHRGVGAAVGAQVEGIAAGAVERRAECRRGAGDVEGVVAGEGLNGQRLNAAVSQRLDTEQRQRSAGDVERVVAGGAGDVEQLVGAAAAVDVQRHIDGKPEE